MSRSAGSGGPEGKARGHGRSVTGDVGRVGRPEGRPVTPAGQSALEVEGVESQSLCPESPVRCFPAAAGVAVPGCPCCEAAEPLGGQVSRWLEGEERCPFEAVGAPG